MCSGDFSCGESPFRAGFPVTYLYYMAYVTVAMARVGSCFCPVNRIPVRAVISFWTGVQYVCFHGGYLSTVEMI